MPRLFVGLEIPLSISLALERLRGGVPGARWIDRENYHITLTFIGDVDHRLAYEVDASLREIDAPSFRMRAKGIGSFGRASPHALWAGIEAPRPLAELQADTSRAASRLGIALESRKYTPHVTIARLKNCERSALGGYLARNTLFASDWFTVDRFVLYSSRPSKGGGPYAIERAYPLEGWPAEETSAGE